MSAAAGAVTGLLARPATPGGPTTGTPAPSEGTRP